MPSNSLMGGTCKDAFKHFDESHNPLGQAKCMTGVHGSVPHYAARRFHGRWHTPLGQAKCVRRDARFGVYERVQRSVWVNQPTWLFSGGPFKKKHLQKLRGSGGPGAGAPLESLQTGCKRKLHTVGTQTVDHQPHEASNQRL